LKVPPGSYYKKMQRRKVPVKRKGRTAPGYCLKTDGTKIEDKELEALLLKIYSYDDPYDPRFYLKVLGSKKLSKYLYEQYGIIVNHKKLHRIRRKLGLVRRYEPRYTYPVRRSTEHRINREGVLWEADIKFIRTNLEGNIALLDIIDVYTREIVGSYIGKSCKKEDFISLVKEAILWQETIPKIMRTDNGSQFSAIDTRLFFEKLGIIQEFGMRRHPDSQAHIEAQHANVQREFIMLNEFNDAEEVHRKYKVYMDFYHNLRPHASLNYMTPSAFKKLGQKGKIQSIRP